MNPMIQLKTAILLLLTSLTWFALSPVARGAEGGLGNGNTAEGAGALFSLLPPSPITRLLVQMRCLETKPEAPTRPSVPMRSLWTCSATPTRPPVIRALENNNADNNTADGYQALFINTTGTLNTATGVQALTNNNADNNTATGAAALTSNSTGHDNTATGAFALETNNGSFNTATGEQALKANSSGTSNTATGVNGLLNNTMGNNNTTNGVDSLELIRPEITTRPTVTLL
jgi:hypothetical protein